MNGLRALRAQGAGNLPVSAGNLPVNAEIPAALPAGGYRVEIVSRYSGSGTPLKELRTITYQLVLTVPEAAKSGS